MSERTKDFIFRCSGSLDVGYERIVSVPIPFNRSLKEFVQFSVLHYSIPIFAEHDFYKQLQAFIDKEMELYYDKRNFNVVEQFRTGKSDIENMVKLWEKIFRDETMEYGERRCATDEELFATAYHKLVHSPVHSTMLRKECDFAQAVRKRTEKRDKQILVLTEKQTEEMNSAVDNLHVSVDEQSINKLVAKHFEDQSMLQGKWSSELDTLKEVQRRDYRNWLMLVLEENQANSSLPTPTRSPEDPTGMIMFDRNSKRGIPHSPTFEESFTIHLGSQLKQMHNIRILAASVMDFCAINDESDSWSEPTPQLLQTALDLYSNDLVGLVLISDSLINSHSQLNKDFIQACQRSTEFHFSHVEDQLEKISDNTKKNLQPKRMENFEKGLYAYSGHVPKTPNSKSLQPGDFYVTRHSNLAKVHVVFHMVADDSIRQSDINSRHPVLLGLRNILKTACSNDVTTLTIPLLLQYEMSEEMTVTWCTKRAELVFKCVKGFMIEMASWGGSELKNLQFLLPQGISSSVFSSLTGMFPSIFKVSNPVVLRSTPQRSIRSKSSSNSKI